MRGARKGTGSPFSRRSSLLNLRREGRKEGSRGRVWGRCSCALQVQLAAAWLAELECPVAPETRGRPPGLRRQCGEMAGKTYCQRQAIANFS